MAILMTEMPANVALTCPSEQLASITIAGYRRGQCPIWRSQGPGWRRCGRQRLREWAAPVKVAGVSQRDEDKISHVGNGTGMIVNVDSH